MENKNLILVRSFIRNHRYRLLMVGLLFMYSCNLLDEEVLNSRKAFIGSYSIQQKCGNSQDPYTLVITEGSSSSEILLSGIEPFGDEIIATISGNILTISSQSVRLKGQTASAKVSGSGTLTDGSIIEINFEFDFGGTTSCKATGYKL
ncbi:hypothetical protein QNI16_25390 [Cytophagaceae bacterium YF14B1]|uniref:Uncharacterized protein n=1 Tax=Xanthocytophaga flava TaxID=3048013 RepID=A0AAE3QUR2_9BACT|nr:hypothetical protein [Xanthocytophaga flavus]MDJ1483860.1 hypothetical protein [Xanthocytophaga flavus]